MTVLLILAVVVYAVYWFARRAAGGTASYTYEQYVDEHGNTIEQVKENEGNN
jgi:hypothetical protein